MIIRKIPVAVATFLVATALAGCITLLPKAKPIQLYRFGAPDNTASPAVTSNSYNITKAGTAFNRAAQGDRLLTVRGSETAYIADARWVSPASILFDEALTRTFDKAPGCARILISGDPSLPDAIMRVEVRNFETRYGGRRPIAVVEAHLTLIRTRDRMVLADQMLHVEQPAESNRVTAIVEALDTASAKVMNEIADTTNAKAAQNSCGLSRSGAAATTTTTVKAR